MYVTMFCGECVGEHLFGVFALVLGRQAAETVEIVAPGFAAVGGDGKCQLYVFDVSGCDVCSCCFNCLGETA